MTELALARGRAAAGSGPDSWRFSRRISWLKIVSEAPRIIYVENLFVTYCVTNLLGSQTQ